MTPDQARKLLPLLADGELPEADRRALQALLERSPELAEELRRWEALRRCAHRALAAEPAPPALTPRIRAALSRETARRRLQVGGGLLAVAAAALLFFWLRGAQRPAPSDLVRPPQVTLVRADAFAQFHRRCAVTNHHRQYEYDPPSCSESAFAAVAPQTCFRFLIPDLTADGFELDGVCRCFDRAVDLHVIHAHYVGEHDGQPVVLSVFSVDRLISLGGAAHASRIDGRDYELESADGVNVLKWDEQQSSFAMCSAADADALERLAADVQAAIRDQLAPALARGN